MVEDLKGLKMATMDIDSKLLIGVLFLLSSFLVPDLSRPIQILFWQTAMIFFFVASMFIRMHLQGFHCPPCQIEKPKLGSLAEC
uniref:Uncharacterized protein n=1 Tax=Arundo donax TaxID=35708 RepID=A0A0A8ZVM3_ARUDO